MSGGAAPKAKGSRFERDICARLSSWVSGGRTTDLFWRSALSGGRGTRRVTKHGPQGVSGDICSVAAGGHALTDAYHVECKHVKDMAFTSFVLKGNGWLAAEWHRCKKQAAQHRKMPLMIVKQNLYPVIVLQAWQSPATVPDGIFLPAHGCVLRGLEDMLAEPFTVPRLRMRL